MPHWASDLEKECRWLPTLAPRLPLRVPEPVALGRPTSAYPLPWAVYRWIEGEPFASELLTDERRAAQDLARFVAELRAAGPAFAALATRTVEEVLADAASDR
jgi:aminoglycoside phosphotransferase (APT) family kinase protein